MQIHMPTTWDAAVITFAAAPSETGTYNPVTKDDGSEYQLTVAANKVVVCDATAMAIASTQWLKLRSGTSGAAVNQTSDRTLELTLLD